MKKKPLVWRGISETWYVTENDAELTDLPGVEPQRASWRDAITAALEYTAEPS